MHPFSLCRLIHLKNFSAKNSSRSLIEIPLNQMFALRVAKNRYVFDWLRKRARKEKSLLQFLCLFAFHWLSRPSRKKDSRHKKIRIFIACIKTRHNVFAVFTPISACKDDDSEVTWTSRPFPNRTLSVETWFSDFFLNFSTTDLECFNIDELKTLRFKAASHERKKVHL